MDRPRVDGDHIPADPLIDTATVRPIAPVLGTLVAEPWPARRTRRARLVLVAMVVSFPVVATAATWWGVSAQEQREVVSFRGSEADELLEIDATALAMLPTLGELTLRMVFRPKGYLVKGDRLTQDVTLLVNDQSGRNLRTFERGSVMDPITVVVPVSGSSARYPFDSYRGVLRLAASVGDASTSEPLALDVALTAALEEFSLVASTEATTNSVRVDLDLERRRASMVWVAFFMFICWAIALSCAGVVWWLVVTNSEAPLWAYSLFAAVLFALPGLRLSLPGAPRYGVLVDWAAFYWSVAIVAIGLVVVLLAWNVNVRALFREGLRARRATDPPPVPQPDAAGDTPDRPDLDDHGEAT